MEIYNFSEHIGVFQISDKIIDPLIPHLYQIKEDNPESDNYSNINGWQKNHIHDIPCMLPLKEKLMKCVNEYLSFIHNKYCVDDIPPWVLSMDNMFVNINKKGSYHTLHRHAGSNYSGVVYLNYPDDSGCIYIQSPFTSPWMTGIQAHLHQGLDRVFEPEKGMCIVFPSYMMHHVGPNMSDEDRIAISFNATCHFNNQVVELLEESGK